MDKLREIKSIDITKDAVRPHLSLEFRTTNGRKIFVLQEDGEEIRDLAYCCVAFCDKVPTNEKELEEYSNPTGKIAIAYTVWSTEWRKGAGRDIILAIREKLIEDTERLFGVERMITLSPLTNMAKRFHERNGAKLLNHNDESYNFEYNLNDDE